MDRLRNHDIFLSFDEASDIGYDRNTSALQTMAQGAADANSDLAKNYWKAFYAGIANVIIFYKTCLEVKIT